MQVVIISGSKKDSWFIKKITDKLDELNISHQLYYASAHKEPKEVLSVLEKYQNQKVVCVTVAGMSNALSGFVAANSDFITIACPPYKDQTDMMVNLHSTMQMPSNVPVLTILNPSNCALAISRLLQ